MQGSQDPQSTVRRMYRALLRLLPFEFRAEFGRDMEQAFSEEQEDVRARRSRAETLGFWLRTLRDFARTAPREQWDVLRQDVRVGARLLTRNPGFSATAILTLALGIGGSTSIFSVIYAVVLRPLAFPESERVVRIGWAGAQEGVAAVVLRPASYPDLEALRQKSAAFDAIGGMRYDFLSSEQRSLSVPLGNNVFVSPMMASASLFELFGASAVLGRLPDERDEQPGAPPVVVLSYRTWTSLYGQDPGVIGQNLRRYIEKDRYKPVTIVGVLAPGAFPYPISQEVPTWASLDTDTIRYVDDSGRHSFYFNLQVYGRLAHGVSLDAARAEVAALTPHLAPGLPDTDAFRNTSLRPVLVRDEVIRNVRAPLLAFLAAVSCLLLVAAANVASLVLARTMSRRQEFAARFALGARPFRIARQLLTESAMLAIAGGTLGLAVAWAGRRAFVAISPSMPRLDQSGIGTPALLFALGGVLLATCAAGVVPALQASRRSVADGLRRAGGASAAATGFSKPLATLAAAEVAVVLVLFAGTGLLVNSFARLILFDLGIDSRSIVMFTIAHTVQPPASSRPAPRTEGQQTAAMLSDGQRVRSAIDEELIRSVSAVPGVAAAGLTGDDPFGSPYRAGADIQIGDSRLKVSPRLRVASATAFDTLGMHLAGGRWFTEGDREGTPLVAVVNHTMARFWSGRSPIGDRIVQGRRVLEIVGIVADVHDRGARQDVRPTLYLSSAQTFPDPVMLFVRTRPGMNGVERVVAAELARMGDRIKVGGPSRLEDIWWRQLADARFLTSVLVTFSLLALGIALVGVHGVLRFSVAQRTREMGIRRALGATRLDLVALIVGHALRFALAGCLVGLVAAVAAGPAIGSLLFGITPADPLTLAAATSLLITAVVVAAYLPARRASAVDPALSLRCE
jgi:putative ABC transport system permease protein